MPKKQRNIVCWLHIPLQYPNGTPIEGETFNRFLEEIDKRFIGASPLGVVPGRWMGIVEPMERMEFSIPKSMLPELEKFARAVGKVMKQKEMYLIVNAQADARFLPIDEDVDDLGLQISGGGQ